MATKVFTVDNLETEADVNRLIAQDCVDSATAVAIVTLLSGFWAFPRVITRLTHAIPIAVEYKQGFGMMTSSVLAYLVAGFTKEQCETRVRRLVREKHNIDV